MKIREKLDLLRRRLLSSGEPGHNSCVDGLRTGAEEIKRLEDDSEALQTRLGTAETRLESVRGYIERELETLQEPAYQDAVGAPFALALTERLIELGQLAVDPTAPNVLASSYGRRRDALVDLGLATLTEAEELFAGLKDLTRMDDGRPEELEKRLKGLRNTITSLGEDLQEACSLLEKPWTPLDYKTNIDGAVFYYGTDKVLYIVDPAKPLPGDYEPPPEALSYAFEEAQEPQGVPPEILEAIELQRRAAPGTRYAGYKIFGFPVYITDEGGGFPNARPLYRTEAGATAPPPPATNAPPSGFEFGRVSPLPLTFEEDSIDLRNLRSLAEETVARAFELSPEALRGKGLHADEEPELLLAVGGCNKKCYGAERCAVGWPDGSCGALPQGQGRPPAEIGREPGEYPDTDEPDVEGDRDPDKVRGFYSKWGVKRLNDPSGKHAGCSLIVLDLDHDKFALPAAWEYVLQARQGGYRLLAADIEARLLEREGGLPHSLQAGLDQIPGSILDGLEDAFKAVHAVDATYADGSLEDFIASNLEGVNILRACFATYSQKPAPVAEAVVEARRVANEHLNAVAVAFLLNAIDGGTIASQRVEAVRAGLIWLRAYFNNPEGASIQEPPAGMVEGERDTTFKAPYMRTAVHNALVSADAGLRYGFNLLTGNDATGKLWKLDFIREAILAVQRQLRREARAEDKPYPDNELEEYERRMPADLLKALEIVNRLQDYLEGDDMPAGYTLDGVRGDFADLRNFLRDVAPTWGEPTGTPLEIVDRLYGAIWTGAACKNVYESLASLNAIREVVRRAQHPEVNGDGVRLAFTRLYGFIREAVESPDSGEAGKALALIHSYLVTVENALARFTANPDELERINEELKDIRRELGYAKEQLEATEQSLDDMRRDYQREQVRAEQLRRENNTLRRKATAVTRVRGVLVSMSAAFEGGDAEYRERLRTALGRQGYAEIMEGVAHIARVLAELDTPEEERKTIPHPFARQMDVSEVLSGDMHPLEIAFRDRGTSPALDVHRILEALKAEGLEGVPGLADMLRRLDRIRKFIVSPPPPAMPYGKVGVTALGALAEIDQVISYLKGRGRDYLTLKASFDSAFDRAERLTQEVEQVRAEGEVSGQRAEELRGRLVLLTGAHARKVRELEAEASLKDAGLLMALAIGKRLYSCVDAHTQMFSAFRKAIGQLEDGTMLQARPEFNELTPEQAAGRLLGEIKALSESSRMAGREEMKLADDNTPRYALEILRGGSTVQEANGE